MAFEQLVTVAWALVLLVAVILGVSYGGSSSASDPHALRLLIPVSVGMLVTVHLMWQRRVNHTFLLGFTLGAVGCCGVGLHHWIAGPWSLLALPALGLGVFFELRGAVRGPGDTVFDRHALMTRRGRRLLSAPGNREAVRQGLITSNSQGGAGLMSLRGWCVLVALLCLAGAGEAVVSAFHG